MAQIEQSYLDWALGDFSGYLAADELYDGPFCVLSMVDNRTFKRIASRVLEHDPTQDDIRDFFRSFRAQLDARQLVVCGITTDGSSLYPEVIQEVFGPVPHQLCQFHVIAELTQAVLHAVAKGRKPLAAQRPKRARGRPSKRARKVTRQSQHFQLAIFGMNAPISNPPGNFIWIRSATLDFYPAEHAYTPPAFAPAITKNDPALDAIIPADATLERIATGFLFTEGPVWVPSSDTSPGYLLFSDPNANTIYRWSPDGQVSVYKTTSGYTGVDIGEYPQPGSNGLTLDREGRVTINEHGNRRVTRLEKTGFLTVLADQYEGKRLNSPNDLVYRSDGALYFTDPPFGLPKFYDDPRKELPYSGIFCWRDGKLQLVSTDLKGPNGLAFSPDERYLYVGNWDPEKKIIMRYDVNADGTLANGRVFFDMTSAPGEDAIDGIKVDQQGNLYVSGPGGVWIIAPDGKHLGTLRGPEHPHNLAWGDDDGRALYLTAQTSVYRIRLNIPGIRPGATKS